jgi:hypothetical protein
MPLNSSRNIRTGFLRIALTLAILSSGCGRIAVSDQEASTSIHVWAAVSVSPILYTTEHVNVFFAATNLGNEPIDRTLVREETVLVINGAELQESSIMFGNGLGAGPGALAPGKSVNFVYQLTNRFKMPGLYRLVWKGKGFESLPIEFRVADDPY